MKQILLIIALIVANYCQIVAQDTTANQHFKLINQFNSIDDVYLKHPELRPKNTRIVIDKSEILFYDKNNNIVKSMKRGQNVAVDTSVSFSGRKISNGVRKEFSYKLIDDKFLTETIGLVGPDGSDQYLAIEKRLYNIIGDYITKISPYNSIVVSQDGKYFSSYYAGESNFGTLELFNSQGEILCTHDISSESIIKFLPGSNLISIYNPELMQLSLIDKNCNLAFDIDIFEKLSITTNGNYFFSPSQDLLLLSFSRRGVYLIDENQNLLWEDENEKIVQHCLFKEVENEIIILVWDNLSKWKNTYAIKRLDLSNGNTIESLELEEMFALDNSYFIIKQEGRYYEYLVN